MISMLFTFAAGCGGGNTSEKELPYKPLIKPDLMWDTDALFSRTRNRNARQNRRLY